MNDLVAESSTASSSACKEKKQLKDFKNVPHSSIRRILHGILHLYPYKFQSLKRLQPGHTPIRELSAELTMAKIKNDPQGLLNIL